MTFHPDRSDRRHHQRPGARRHSGRRAHHRCRPGTGDGRRRGQARRSRSGDDQEAGRRRERRDAVIMDIVKLAISNARLTISVLFFLMLAGAVAYQSTPKEAEPDVPIPVMYVSLIYQGISPEDSERLLLRPMETKLKSLKGLKEMRSAAFQGGGYVLVEFQPSDRSGDGAAGHPQQGAGCQGRPAAGGRGADGHRGQHLGIPGAGRDAFRQRAGARADGCRARAARPHRGSARRSRGHASRRARRSRRGRHRPDEAVLLRAAARPADPGRRRHPTAWWRPATSKARRANTPSRFRR